MKQNKKTKNWIMPDEKRTELLAIAATLDAPSLAGKHFNIESWYYEMCPHLAKEICKILGADYETYK